MGDLYRKRPVVVEAMQWDGANSSQIKAFMLGWPTPPRPMQDGTLEIVTLEGVMRVDPGDWIIKGIKGEFYPCKPDIFAATYDPVDPPVPKEET